MKDEPSKDFNQAHCEKTICASQTPLALNDWVHWSSPKTPENENEITPYETPI
jgi:hypothetical protein